MGFSGSIVLNTQGAFLAVHHGPLGPSAIGEQNAAGGIAGLLAPLSLGFIAATAVDWRLALLVGPLAFALTVALRGPNPASEDESSFPPAAHTHLPAAYWWAWGALALCIGVEFSFIMWAGDVLRTQTGASVALAAGGLTAVAGGIVVSRMLIPALLRKLHLERLFRLALLLPGLAWVPMWLSDNTSVALLSMVVIGFGIGLHYPLGLARMVLRADGHADLATNRSAFASGIAIGLAPLGLGALADNIGVHWAFVAVPVMLALAALASAKGRTD